jgi:hypothetical protein
MQTTCNFFGIACRVAAFSFLLAGTASLANAQQASSIAPAATTPFFLAASSAPDYAASYFGTSSSSSSSSSDAAAEENLNMAAPDSAQPPPRRRYGQPNYSDSHNNPDGSPKWTFLGGFGLTLPIGNTHFYDTPAWGLQVGGGRNFNKTLGVMLQFDYDHFGLQGATLANQEYVYNYYCTTSLQNQGLCSPISNLDGSSHVWSFTIDPTFNIPTDGAVGAYFVVGGGFYHNVTDFTQAGVAEYCDPFYGCYEYTANQTIDHYISNAFGVNAGLGATYKFSRFSNQRFYVEARYVVVLNNHYTGITASNVGTSFGQNYNGSDFYPANSNRTTYIPVKFGIRF